MKVEFVRGDNIFIVEKDGVFYIVNLITRKVEKADPPNMPDMFLKFGYFEDADELDPATMRNIESVLNTYKDE
jgi:hypothetical protein